MHERHSRVGGVHEAGYFEFGVKVFVGLLEEACNLFL